MGKFVLNKAGVGQLLKDMEPVVAAAAESIADAAGPGFEASSIVGSRRALAMARSTTYAAAKAEAVDGALSRAISAGNL